MEQNCNNIVDIRYQQTGEATATDALGMREMQAKAYEARQKRFLLIKAPPASGKSRALMFIALDKLVHQGLKKVVVAVPEKSIGRSFQNTKLMPYGFFADWEVAPYFNLTDVKNEKDKKGRFIEFFRQSRTKILVCAHATLRNGMKEIPDEDFNDTLLAIDEFHHTSADANSNLGDVVRRVMNNSTGHIVAMTGSYFRGDGIPVLRVEDEARFYPVPYNYYQQLNGYKYLKNLVLGYHFYHGNYLDHIREVLDTTKKTIIHIPSVNARASTGIGKYAETEEIMKAIGTVEQKDYNTGIYSVRTVDGRLLKVADLVEDDQKERNMVQGYLQRMKHREDMDIIIALSSEKTKLIVQEQLDDLKAAILQDESVVKAISGSTTAETITQHLVPKVIRERFPDFSEDEVEEVRQHVLLDIMIKGNDIVDDKGNPIDISSNEEQESEGNRLIKIANRFVNIDRLSINLIDTINPFQRAYEVLSKSVDAPTLKIILDTIAEQKFDLTPDQAITIFKGPLKQYVAEHDGRLPDISHPDPKVREMAAALQMIKNLKA